ncbi:MAG: response regulator [Alicyclobacillus sp.]|nr:response regulator [Alicyclobacillus sp.]
MYKVLLCDDEPIVRTAISQLVPWQDHGTSLVGLAGNGTAALQQIRVHHPDIVICDIKMPGMDGLELIERVREEDPDVVFVVLSGYAEFQFARRAMAMGVQYYLLKPCNEHEITKVLDDVVEQLDKRRENRQHVLRMERELEGLQLQMEEQVLRELITLAGVVTDSLGQQMTRLGWLGRRIRLLVFTADGRDAREALPQFVKEMTAHVMWRQGLGLRRVADAWLGDHWLFVVEEADTGRLRSELQKLLKEISPWERVSIAVSEEADMVQLSSLYREACACLEQRFYLGAGRILTPEDGWEPASSLPPLKHSLDAIVHAVIAGNTAGVQQSLSKFFDGLRSARAPVAEARAACLELVVALGRHVRKETMLASLRRIGTRIADVWLDEIEQDIQAAALQVTSEYAVFSKPHENQLVKRVVEHVREQYSDAELNLSRLAREHFYLSPDYLGRVFREVTGVRFTDFLTTVRVQRAQDLLRGQPRLTIADVAEQVGFGPNAPYFSQVFKRCTGYTPSEYRKVSAGRSNPIGEEGNCDDTGITHVLVGASGRGVDRASVYVER